LCLQDGKAEAQTRIEELEAAKRKLERKLTQLSAKTSALKEANAAQTVTLEGLQVRAQHGSFHVKTLNPNINILKTHTYVFRSII
jgi:chromosome segregation ATPase